MKKKRLLINGFLFLQSQICNEFENLEKNFLKQIRNLNQKSGIRKKPAKVVGFLSSLKTEIFLIKLA